MDAIDEYNNRYFREDVISFGAIEHVALRHFRQICILYSKHDAPKLDGIPTS